MPLTILDPNTALIVIDLQKGIVDGTSFIPSARSLTGRARCSMFSARSASSRAGQCGGAGAGPHRTGSARQPDICRGMDRASTPTGSATGRYRRRQAKLGRIRNNGS